MTFKIKPKIGKFVPHHLIDGQWGILDTSTGEIKRQEDNFLKIERYRSERWAAKRCKELNK